ncbi:TerD family protein [Actinomadura sp. 3N508]|uniref:TerD family protein n=1 Tax=Actinomadura sp. 3N508 TaxID=3375153 RepID=UPI0037A8D04F
MAKGANIDLSGLTTATGPVTVALSWIDPSGEGEADVSVLLVDANGKVGSDADFVFYNQLATADESVRLLGKAPTATGSEDRILVDLDALRPEVQRVVIAASRYAGATFGALDDLRLAVSEGNGEVLLTFDINDADTETAFISGSCTAGRRLEIPSGWARATRPGSRAWPPTSALTSTTLRKRKEPPRPPRSRPPHPIRNSQAPPGPRHHKPARWGNALQER